jgi:hypothetical protein
MDTFYYEDGAYGEIDFGLAEGEVLTGMTNINGNIYVMSDRRTFILRPKSKWRIFVDRVRGWFNV